MISLLSIILTKKLLEVTLVEAFGENLDYLGAAILEKEELSTQFVV